MIEVLKQALDALETEVSIDWTNNDEFNASAEKMHDAITSLRQAIAELESQEPVACGTYQEVTDTMNALWAGTLEQVQIAEEMKNKKLYTVPPQRQPLTDEEIRKAKHHMVEGAYHYSFQQGVRYAEAAHGIKGEA